MTVAIYEIVGAIISVGVQEVWSRGHTVKELAWVNYFDCRIFVVYNDLSRHTSASCTTCSRQHKLSYLMSNAKVGSMLDSVPSLPISRSVLYSGIITEISDISHLKYDIYRLRVESSTFHEQCRLAIFLNASATTLSWCATWFCCQLWFLTWLGTGSICWNEDRKLRILEDRVSVVNIRISTGEEGEKWCKKIP